MLNGVIRQLDSYIMPKSHHPWLSSSSIDHIKKGVGCSPIISRLDTTKLLAQQNIGFFISPRRHRKRQNGESVVKPLLAPCEIRKGACNPSPRKGSASLSKRHKCSGFSVRAFIVSVLLSIFSLYLLGALEIFDLVEKGVLAYPWCRWVGQMGCGHDVSRQPCLKIENCGLRMWAKQGAKKENRNIDTHALNHL